MKSEKWKSSRSPSPEEALQLFLPVATKREIAVRAAETGETIRVVVLRALHAYGFKVPSGSFVDRRKEP
jgi:hypothetical protein